VAAQAVDVEVAAERLRWPVWRRPVRRWRASEPEEAGDDGVQGGARAGGGRARWAAAAGMVGGGRVQTRGPI
jgi:hypothetical protein